MSEEGTITVDDVVSAIEDMSAQERQIFFERLGQMAIDWFPSRAAVTDIMFPSVRSNQRHVNALTLCREFVEENGYITRSHVSHIIGNMDASTFRRAIIKKLIDEGAISDSNRKWKRNGQGQAHKVYRDNTNRYQSLFNDQPTRVSTDSNSIVKEPQKTAEKFVREVLAVNRAALQGRYGDVANLIDDLNKLRYSDVNAENLKDWCKVVKQVIRQLKEELPTLEKYRIGSNKIRVPTNSGVMMHE